jgi:hypothetical protein
VTQFEYCEVIAEPIYLIRILSAAEKHKKNNKIEAAATKRVLRNINWYNKLISWSRVFLQKQLVDELQKKCYVFLETRQHNSP